MGASGFNKPIWLALSVNDKDGTKLRSGENISDILPLLNEYKPAAVLINCSAPEAVSTALPLLREAKIPIGGYANGFVEIAKSNLIMSMYLLQRPCLPLTKQEVH